MNINKVILDDVEKIVNSNIDWTRFYNKTILITGAAGFLPAYLVETLMYLNRIENNANIKVIGLVRNLPKANLRFAHLLDSSNFSILTQDVCQKIEINHELDFIIHAASQASPKYYGQDPVGTINANILGTTNLLELAYKKNIEGFLYFSSSEVYGSLTDEDIPTIETRFGSIDPCNVRSCYSEGKRAGETIAISWHHQYKIPIYIVRPFHTYGPGMDLNDGRVYADFIRDIVNDNNIIMKSDGSAVRAFCYILDATKAFFKVLLDGKVGNAYNVGNDKMAVSILNLAETLIKLFPEKELSVIKKEDENMFYIKSVVSKNIPNINKIEQIGWEPETSILDGFSKTIKYYLK